MGGSGGVTWPGWWTGVECIDLCCGVGQASGLYTPSEGEQSDGVINTNTCTTTTATTTTIKMTDREDKVYKAKLAEQAERYDGED